jgi:hypothetical protein
MALGQIDPARLQGDALVRWYLRSPAEIEEERRRDSARSHDAFFSRPRDDQIFKSSPAGASAAPWGPVGDERGSNDPRSPRERLRLAAANSRGLWDYWGFRGCQSCHGYTPETLPSYGGHSPFPPNYSPRSGSSGGSSPRPRRDEHEQCEIQDQNDRRICGNQPMPQDRAICHASATQRRAHCDRFDELEYPALDTAKRLTGH